MNIKLKFDRDYFNSLKESRLRYYYIRSYTMYRIPILNIWCKEGLSKVWFYLAWNLLKNLNSFSAATYLFYLRLVTRIWKIGGRKDYPYKLAMNILHCFYNPAQKYNNLYRHNS